MIPFSTNLPVTIETTIREDLASGLISCASATVLCRDTVAYRGFFGNADENTPLNETHLFRMASMTKPVTAVCVLRQIENGKLSLNDPAEAYIPALSKLRVAETDGHGNLTGSHPASRPITVKDLLTHSSGLGSGAVFAQAGYEFAGTLGSMMDTWGASLLEFDPGAAFSYSGLVGFDVLAHLVELTSDMSYEEYAKTYLFEPLGMSDTGFTPTEDRWRRFVRMHMTEDGRAKPVDMGRHVFANLPLTYHSGGAGLFSTQDDYTRFAGMLLGGGTFSGVRILKEEKVRTMRTPHLPPMLPGTDATYSWGLSVRVITADNGSQAPLTTGAYGWSGAYGTHFWCDPAHDLCVVYCSNMTTAGGSGALTARHIEKAVTDCIIG